MHRNFGAQAFSLLVSIKKKEPVRSGWRKQNNVHTFMYTLLRSQLFIKMGEGSRQRSSSKALALCWLHVTLYLKYWRSANNTTPSPFPVNTKWWEARCKKGKSQAFAISVHTAHYSCLTTVRGKFHKGNTVSLLASFQHMACDGSCIERPASQPAVCPNNCDRASWTWLKHKNSAHSEGCGG